MISLGTAQHAQPKNMRLCSLKPAPHMEMLNMHNVHNPLHVRARARSVAIYMTLACIYTVVQVVQVVNIYIDQIVKYAQPRSLRLCTLCIDENELG
jgi:hypothetical protein